jgi:hypothetical protein
MTTNAPVASASACAQVQLIGRCAVIQVDGFAFTGELISTFLDACESCAQYENLWGDHDPESLLASATDVTFRQLFAFDGRQRGTSGACIVEARMKASIC